MMHFFFKLFEINKDSDNEYDTLIIKQLIHEIIMIKIERKKKWLNISFVIYRKN